MTYVPHWRLSLLGRMPDATGSEMFSMNISLDRFDDGGLINPLLDPNDTVWDDIAQDAADWFGNAATGINSKAHLVSIKVAPIGADGKYTGPPIEREVGQPGGVVGTRMPNQVARVVTLETGADLGRIKGRFYVPLPTFTIQDDGRWTDTQVNGAEAQDAAFIEALGNQPGLDVLDIRVCVASQGRRNQNGTLRLQPANYPVTAVSVGRVPDTQRRRRNKLTEARTSTAIDQDGP
jgi:hypothetical protein